jgi:signal transduction histidine kinase
VTRPALRAGLGTRVTALFAAGALVLSAALAAATYQLARSSLVQERERTAVRSAYFDAAVVQNGLSVPDPDLVEVLRRLDTGTARRPVIRRDGEWYARSADDGLIRAIPATLQRMAEDEQAALQRVRLPGGPALVVAVPLPDVRATYYEVNDQEELQDTLRSLAVILTLVALGTAAAGAALGAWASRRVLRPLSSVTAAATSITAGNLDARLDPAREPEIARLAASFNAMVDELQARLERDRRFAADVSHELRSPLQTLSAAAAVLDRRREALDPRSAAALGLLTGELERFSQLVTDLLELARGDRPVERAPVDIAELLDATCLPRGLAPEVERPLVAEVDQRRLRQVLANLLDNADRHGGGPVAVRAGRGGGVLWLEVDDEGPGVPVDERELIFGRFGRGRTAGVRASGDGTGLGLALVAQHVAAHGGRVEVRDRPGGGARFRVEVPA